MPEVRVSPARAAAADANLAGTTQAGAGRSLSQATIRAAVPLRARALAGRARGVLSFRNISAVYIFAALFVIFSLWVPATFLTTGVWKSLVDNQALTALVAVGLVIPLAAGAFNLAIGTEVGMGGILVAWLLAREGVSIAPAVALTIAAGALIGITSGLLIVRARIDSFIATLGMSSVLLALIAWVSSSEQILNLGASFQKLGTTQLLGLTYPVWFMLLVALVVWYVLERTPAGRRVYATGGNIDAARLAGVRTSLVIVLSLMACGAIAASTGILASSQLATGDPTVGPAYLLPAYAAAFLGSTQFKGGRYNVWGTVVAVYVLATGVKGLQLAGAPVWIPDLFNGVALLLAVGLAKYQGTARRAKAIRHALRMDRKPAAAARDRARPVREVARPFLRRLHEQLEETVDLAVLDGDRVRFIDQIAAPTRLRAVSAVGDSFPLHCTANGKALLAALPDETAEALTGGHLGALTSHTITSGDGLRAELAQVRRDGVAYDREEHTEGICAAGAVILNSDGPVTAISVPMPVQRFYGNEERVARLVREACAACSQALGHTQRATGPEQDIDR